MSCPGVLKQTNIDRIVASLNTIDDLDKAIAIVTLRHQYGIIDLKKIESLNKVFEEDGISFELLIS